MSNDQKDKKEQAFTQEGVFRLLSLMLDKGVATTVEFSKKEFVGNIASAISDDNSTRQHRKGDIGSKYPKKFDEPQVGLTVKTVLNVHTLIPFIGEILPKFDTTPHAKHDVVSFDEEKRRDAEVLKVANFISDNREFDSIGLNKLGTPNTIGSKFVEPEFNPQLEKQAEQLLKGWADKGLIDKWQSGEAATSQKSEQQAVAEKIKAAEPAYVDKLVMATTPTQLKDNAKLALDQLNENEFPEFKLALKKKSELMRSNQGDMKLRGEYDDLSVETTKIRGSVRMLEVVSGLEISDAQKRWRDEPKFDQNDVDLLQKASKMSDTVAKFLETSEFAIHEYLSQRRMRLNVDETDKGMPAGSVISADSAQITKAQDITKH